MVEIEKKMNISLNKKKLRIKWLSVLNHITKLEFYKFIYILFEIIFNIFILDNKINK
jgi:hypothetical protein